MLCCHGNSCRDCRYRENRGWYRGFNLSYERAKTAVLGKIVGLLRMKLDPQRGVFWHHLGDFVRGGTLASAGCGRQGHTGAVGAQSSCPACGRRGADSGCIGTDRLGNVVFN